MAEKLAKYPTKTNDMIHRKVGTEVMAINLTNKFFYNLDPVGSFIFDRCDGQHSVAQIAAELVKEYAVEPDVAAGDCEQFLQELVQEGILVWGPVPEAINPA
jgi:hypothetical protein